MNPTTIAEIAAGAAVLATIGGAIKHFAKAGGGLYKFGAFLSTLGTDVVSLVKLGGAGGQS